MLHDCFPRHDVRSIRSPWTCHQHRRLEIGSYDLWITNGFRSLAVQNPSSIKSGRT